MFLWNTLSTHVLDIVLFLLFCTPLKMRFLWKIKFCWVHTFLCGHLATKLSWQVLQSFRSKTHKDFIQSIDGCVYARMKIWLYPVILLLLLLDQKKIPLGVSLINMTYPTLFKPTTFFNIMNTFDLMLLIRMSAWNQKAYKTGQRSWKAS